MSKNLLAEAQAFFFEAMRNGYAANVEKIGLPHMDSYKGIPYGSRDGSMYLIDAYCVNAEHKRAPYSAGTTTIVWRGRPIWWMSYAGWYYKEVIPFLRKALLQAYADDAFVGGRGPNKYVFESRNGRWEYLNTPASNDFGNFEGKETITQFFTENPFKAGEHRYWGVALF